jgi:hypothetical protein
MNFLNSFSKFAKNFGGVITSIASSIFSITKMGADIDGNASDDRSGWSVGFSKNGNRMAIGAVQSSSNIGYVRVYEWNGTAWTKMGADIIGEGAGDNFGYSVTMDQDGSWLAVGAIYNDGAGADAGHVRLYSWSGTAWSQINPDLDGEYAGDQSGFSISMNASLRRIAVGAIFNNGSGVFSGHVRVYSLSAGTWLQIGGDIVGEAADDRSGYSISMNASGNRLAIGATGASGSGLTDNGHVRVYEWNGTAWTKMGADIDGEADLDYSGFSVSMNAFGDRVAIGAPYNNGTAADAGHVRVYSWNGTAWTQLGADIDGEANSDLSGYSVSMDAAGSRVAIGSIYNNGSTGHVRIYYWNGTAWTKLGEDIDGEASADRSGQSISMNEVGNRVAIGAYFNDGNSGLQSDNRGSVRVYCIQGTQAGAPTIISGYVDSSDSFSDVGRFVVSGAQPITWCDSCGSYGTIPSNSGLAIGNGSYEYGAVHTVLFSNAYGSVACTLLLSSSDPN